VPPRPGPSQEGVAKSFLSASTWEPGASSAPLPGSKVVWCQSKGDGVVNKEVTRAICRQHIVCVPSLIASIQPGSQNSRRVRPGRWRQLLFGIRQEDIHAVEQLATGGFERTEEDRLHQGSLSRGTGRPRPHRLWDGEGQGVGNRRTGNQLRWLMIAFFVLEHPEQEIVLVGLPVVYHGWEEDSHRERRHRTIRGRWRLYLVVRCKSAACVV